MEDPRLSGNGGAQSAIEEITAQEAPVGWFQSMKNLVTTVTSTFVAADDTTTSVEDANKLQGIDLYCHENELKRCKKNITSRLRRNVVELYLLALVSMAAFMKMYSKDDDDEGKLVGGEMKEVKVPTAEKSPSSEHLKEVHVSSKVSEIIDEGTGRKSQCRRGRKGSGSHS